MPKGTMGRNPWTMMADGCRKMPLEGVFWFKELVYSKGVIKSTELFTPVYCVHSARGTRGIGFLDEYDVASPEGLSAADGERRSSEYVHLFGAHGQDRPAHFAAHLHLQISHNCHLFCHGAGNRHDAYLWYVFTGTCVPPPSTLCNGLSCAPIPPTPGVLVLAQARPALHTPPSLVAQTRRLPSLPPSPAHRSPRPPSLPSASRLPTTFLAPCDTSHGTRPARASPTLRCCSRAMRSSARRPSSPSPSPFTACRPAPRATKSRRRPGCRGGMPPQACGQDCTMPRVSTGLLARGVWAQRRRETAATRERDETSSLAFY